MLHLACVLFRNRSFAFVYYGADCENLTALRRPRPLTLIDLLYSYRTDPHMYTVDVSKFRLTTNHCWLSTKRHLERHQNVCSWCCRDCNATILIYALWAVATYFSLTHYHVLSPDILRIWLRTRSWHHWTIRRNLICEWLRHHRQLAKYEPQL